MWVANTSIKNDYQEIGRIECITSELVFLTITDEAWPVFQSWWDRSKRIPNSGDVTTHQNVSFMDEVAGQTDGTSMFDDEIRSSTNISDAELGDFLSRPVLAESWTVNPGVVLDETVHPWSKFFRDPYTVRRLANYKLLSCTLKAKFVINGAPFHYGRFLVSYTPMSGYDEMTPTRAAIPADFVGLSQRPHIFLDPTTSSGGTLSMPFMFFKNKVDIVDPYDFLYMGSLRIATLNTLKHSNGASDPVSISMYLWAEDVQLSVPTQHLPLDFPPLPSAAFTRRSPNADEYATGPVSRPASAIAAAASALSSFGVLAPYARATEIGARAIGKMASLFGFSRPVIISTGHYKPNVKPSMATSNQDDDCNKLSLDVKQELTLDPRTFGMTDKDEMSLAYIAGVESYLDTFTFSTTAATEELLWNAVVDPRYQKIVTGTYPEIHYTSLAFAAAPFLKWRGSLKYRFQIIASKYHRGRIKVVYDPEGGSFVGSTANYNTAYTTIVDLKDTTDFTIKVGWGQALTYRDISPPLNPTDTIYDTKPLGYLASLDEYGNGMISVYCVTDLAVPNTTVNNDIQINVFVSADDDIEFAVPTGEVISRLRLTAPDPAPPPPTSTQETEDSTVTGTTPAKTVSRYSKRRPNGADGDDDTSHPQDKDSDDPQGTPVIETFGPTLSLNDKTNLVHFGESIRSFRQLIKRYNAHEFVTVMRPYIQKAQLAQVYFNMQRQALPFEPGYTTSVAPDLKKTYYELLSGNYAYGYMTTLRYLTTAFVGWRGGVRYMIEHSPVMCCDKAAVSTVRYANCTIEDECTIVPISAAQAPSIIDKASAYVFHNDASYQEGGMLTAVGVNPVTNFEVPYYSEYRFAPGRKRANFSSLGSHKWMPCWKHKLQFLFGTIGSPPYFASNINMQHSDIRTFVAAAEDFQVSGFIGAPIFYYEGTIPQV